MKHSFALIALLAVSLGACGRESAPAPGSSAASNPTASATSNTGSPTASGGSASAGDLVTAAKTQQESADTDTGTDASETALERVAALPEEGQLPQGKWVAGQNYQVISPAQPTSAPAGKVEVLEFFWYGCPHCFALDPQVEAWRKVKAPYIEFTRVPIMWGAPHRAHARLFYTLQGLGKLEQLHTAVFDEIHQKHDLLTTQDQQLAFAKAEGITEKDFNDAYSSFAVQTNLQKADDLGRIYKIEGVPTFVINGKYMSDAGMAGSEGNLIQLINDLAASEKRR